MTHQKTLDRITERVASPEPVAAQYDSPANYRGSDLIRHQGLWKTLVEDYRVNPRDPFASGYIALLGYRYGTWTRTLRSPILRKLFRVPYWALYIISRNVLGIEIYDTVKIGRRLNLAHQGGIVVHLNAEIGDDCVIRHGVTFGAGGSWIPKGPVVGDRVSFGPGAVVMGPVTIGDDVTIGPNCTISADIPPKTFVAMPPPRVLPRLNLGLGSRQVQTSGKSSTAKTT